MTARANVTLTDAAGTPLAHVFSPVSSKADVLFWRDRTVTSLSIGQNELSLQQKVPNGQAKTNKFAWKLACPTLEQTSPSTSSGIQPQPTKAYENLMTLVLQFHERATLQERKDLLAMTRDLIDEAIVTTQAEDLEQTF